MIRVKILDAADIRVNRSQCHFPGCDSALNGALRQGQRVHALSTREDRPF